MEICVRNPLILSAAIWLCASVSAAPASGPNECGIAIDLPLGMAVEKSADAGNGVCSLLEVRPQPSPFVNVINVVQWSAVGDLKVNSMAMRDVGFFRLTSPHFISYAGRPSYVDARNGYAQRLTMTRVLERSTVGNLRRQVFRADLRVNWIRPVTEREQSEVTEAFSCIDAVLADGVAVVTVNWCFQTGDRNVEHLVDALRALKAIRNP